MELIGSSIYACYFVGIKCEFVSKKPCLCAFLFFVVCLCTSIDDFLRTFSTSDTSPKRRQDNLGLPNHIESPVWYVCAFIYVFPLLTMFCNLTGIIAKEEILLAHTLFIPSPSSAHIYLTITTIQQLPTRKVQYSMVDLLLTIDLA